MTEVQALELLARLEVISTSLDKLETYLGAVTGAVLLTVGISVSCAVCIFLYRAIKQLF